MTLKQPLSLIDSASRVLGGVIGDQTLLIIDKISVETGSVTSNRNVDLDLNIKKLAEFYDEMVPDNLHNLVTYHTLNYIACKSFEVTQNDFNVFDIALRCHVTKFDFCDWPVDMHSMLHVSMSKLKDLKFLQFQIMYMETKNLNHILKAIEGMKQLETFICYRCTDDVIKVICDNCPLINLNIRNSRCYHTDDLIRSILKLQNLKSLNIKSTEIYKEGRKQLLFGLPNLKTFLYNDLNWLLADLDDSNVTSLENVTYHFWKEFDVTNLTKFCPSIRELDIDNYGVSLDLSNVANLKCLTNLSFAGGDFYECNILTILERRGYQITNLNLSCKIIISLRTLHTIDISCPNLTKFTLQCISFNDEPQFFSVGKAFQNLEYFSNTVFTDNNLTPCLIFFLCNCLKIKEVEFLSAHNLCDADVNKILTFNPLVNLQKLFLELHELTVHSVYNILTSCNQLRRLGCSISDWHNITKSEVEELHDYVRRNNLNIQLVKGWGSPDPASLML